MVEGAEASMLKSARSLTESAETVGEPSNNEVDHARPSSAARISVSKAPARALHSVS